MEGEEEGRRGRGESLNRHMHAVHTDYNSYTVVCTCGYSISIIK